MREPHWLAGTTSRRVTGGRLAAVLLVMELLMSCEEEEEFRGGAPGSAPSPEGRGGRSYKGQAGANPPGWLPGSVPQGFCLVGESP